MKQYKVFEKRWISSYDHKEYVKYYVEENEEDYFYGMGHDKLETAIEVCDLLNRPDPPPPTVRQVYPTSNKVRVYND